ncbi:MAG: Two component transcriptional regulator, winged helix family [Candidatus Nomurabacteria bacterium GW2011_GWE1_32_28]|uniref:Two component transcriptional regulator, winged helix family n=1 Tax=Candidatus Nomurabacteria bacterium GW2011_GWF1_31_48 TaxID=1618767 RepID=A0A0F9YU16_9BACT|nr:MAG: Two component transcriptional regulator, winged helix family [Candidatus Nomurabacteria bacterium GW2011_GWF2_30_133]KKP28376.1 MAG: Two component transcriptional regulator, winged helix family [Candidatus Nomurabacteria bacterium GW2011_GWE2_31_40]KKP29961.1 MAG: Two component transcriptional regulator, winged helix family [Candidatus Nomurabacteria bacterium GW2011_GWF1_31_48]KKP35112.1 MAG: Two component transcriptional regulator, winged helix family [Candidatus Nomurabacteria bacteri
MRILIVEDNEKLAKYTKQMLEEEGYAVDSSYDGEAGERMARSGSHDLVILDIMLPKKDGISLCKSLRDDNINLPIIMITAKEGLDDKILGLDSGADDYLIKPFDMEELLARVRALLRRPKEKVILKLEVQNIVLDNSKHIATQKGILLNLTLKEYSILEYLMLNADQVVTREQLLEHCWDFAYSAFSNITDVYIKQLRKKLKDTNEKYIKTIRGVGYTFKSK